MTRFTNTMIVIAVALLALNLIVLSRIYVQSEDMIITLEKYGQRP